MMAARQTESSRSVFKRSEPMSRHTSWRIGGPVDVYFKPGSREQLAEFLSELDTETPLLWVGLGSNLLVRDGGFRGVVIASHGALGGLINHGDGRVYAEAGVACAKLAKQCVKWSYGNAHFFAGIPGTVGGALAMNAGAFGGETWEHVVSVETIDRRGDIRTLNRDQFDTDYRSVKAAGEESLGEQWFMSGHFQFERSSKDLDADIKSLLARRKSAQPIGLPSCGSVFRNPPGDHAARMIEAVGLKGHRINDAQISDKHANFIINTGAATAADVEALIRLIIKKVHQEFGVQLHPEVRVVGDEQ